MEDKFRIIVVGAGLCGLATAIQLARLGHRVTVLEKERTLSMIGAGIQVAANAQRLFRSWGLDGRLEQLSFAGFSTRVRSYRDGSELSVLDQTVIQQCMIIHRADLLSILGQEAMVSGVDIRYSVNVTDLQQGSSGPVLRLSTGDVERADVVLAADGERSAMRKMITEQTISQYDSGIHVFRLMLSLDELSQHEDLKRVLRLKDMSFWLGPGGNALVYPLKQGNQLNVVLTRTHAPGSVSLLTPSPVSIEVVLDQFGDWDPILLKLLRLGHTALRWTLLTSEKVKKWTNEQHTMCLIGDAAHPMPPWLGQGAAMCFEDAAVLGKLFSQINNRAEIPIVIETFTRLRRPRNEQVLALSIEMCDMYHMQDGKTQQDRDRKFRAGPVVEGYPFFLANPAVNQWLFEFDVAEEVHRGWHRGAVSIADE